MSVKIAIDGPAGAGKSTVARLLADRLGVVYIDTGAMYRAVALLAQRHDCGVEDVSCLVTLATAADIRFEPGTRRVLLGEEDVTQSIRTHAISELASRIAAIPEIRQVLVDKQRELAAHHSVVMEGRDIGTIVLPDADLKIFLDADEAERTHRRFKEMDERGERRTLDSVREEIRRRDNRDRNRAEAPLRLADGAFRLDSTDLSPEQVVYRIMNLLAGVEAAQTYLPASVPKRE